MSADPTAIAVSHAAAPTVVPSAALTEDIMNPPHSRPEPSWRDSRPVVALAPPPLHPTPGITRRTLSAIGRLAHATTSLAMRPVEAWQNHRETKKDREAVAQLRSQLLAGASAYNARLAQRDAEAAQRVAAHIEDRAARKAETTPSRPAPIVPDFSRGASSEISEFVFALGEAGRAMPEADGWEVVETRHDELARKLAEATRDVPDILPKLQPTDRGGLSEEQYQQRIWDAKQARVVAPIEPSKGDDRQGNLLDTAREPDTGR